MNNFDILATISSLEKEIGALTNEDFAAVGKHCTPTPNYDFAIFGAHWSIGAQKLIALHCKKFLEHARLIEQSGNDDFDTPRTRRLESDGAVIRVLMGYEFSERFPHLIENYSPSPSIGPAFSMYMNPVKSDGLIKAPFH